MIFNHLEKGLQIKFSWKERFNILLKGFVQFDAKGTYDYYNHWLNFITQAHEKYGDARRHGETQPEDPVETK